MIGHPSGLRLSRFADGELTGKRERDVTRHLESCARCRERVSFYRELAEAARESEDMPDVTVPGVADEVLRRRAAGERVEAGAGPGSSAATRRRSPEHPRLVALAIAACLILVAVASGVLLRAPEAAAGHSELGFSPGMPTAGSTVEVRYTPSFDLAGYDSLRLRVRGRTRRTPYPARTGVIGDPRAATLYLAGDGTYVGQLRVEPDEVFLAAAVEDFTGEHLDTNLGRLWKVLVAGEDGTPTTASLESEYRVLEASNWAQATEWAAGVTEKFPDDPLGWALQYYHDSRVAPVANTDSLRAFHRAKLRALIAERRDRPADVEGVVWLSIYARTLGEQALQDSLFAELGELDPDDYSRVMWLAFGPGFDSLGTPGSLDHLETVWTRSDGTNDVVAGQALRIAGLAHDTNAVETWIARGLAVPALNGDGLAATLDDTEFAAERARLRRMRVNELHEQEDADRPLDMTVSEFEQSRNLQIRRVVARLARDVELAGDTTGAMPLLKWAAGDAWQPEMLEPYVAHLLAVGDTTTALPAIGVLCADPVAGDAAARRFAPILTRHVDDPDGFARDSEAEYARRVRAGLAVHHRFPAATHLPFIDGTTERAGDVMAGRRTIFFMLEASGSSVDEKINTFARRMTDGAGRDLLGIVLLHTRGGQLPDSLGDAPILTIYDRNYEIAQRLRKFVVEGYAVLDRDLTVVATTYELDTALRVAGGL